MRILLDTCDFLWLITDDKALPAKTRQAVKSGENEVFLSVVSFWEILVKNALGKLEFDEPAIEFIPQQRELHGIRNLNLDEPTVMRLAALPLIHRDPFDRMLLCQAQELGMRLASSDPVMGRYAVALL